MAAKVTIPALLQMKREGQISIGERWLDAKAETYANVAKISLEALSALIADVRAGRQIKG